MNDLDREFEFDFAVCANMLLGMSYKEARNQALEDLREASDKNWEEIKCVL